MAKPPQARGDAEVKATLQRRLRVRFVEKLPPWNPGEEATFFYGEARRLCIMGMAEPCGFPGEDLPEDGGPQWNLDENEASRRRLLAAHLETTSSVEQDLDRQLAKDEAEKQTKIRAAKKAEAERVANNEDILPPEATSGRREFLGGGAK